MKVLLVGGGGREHALIWKMARSHLKPRLYAAPGNAGIEQLATCVPIPITDIDGLLSFALQEKIDFTVVGPEAALEGGIVDRFQEHGLDIFGPSQRAARLETSKAFAKEFMDRHGIPTGQYRMFDSPRDASRFVRQTETPVVIKADGLAAGKGVMVARTQQEALAAVDLIMVEKAFGQAGRRVVIEEYLPGEEVSILALVDGESHLTMIPSQDHKPVFDGDRGPNTGGMGAYAPAQVVTEEILAVVERRILEPAVRGMAQEGSPFQGILYAGLMITDQGPKVVEFNCRFGDPETQVLLPPLQDDLLEVMVDTAGGRLPGRPPLRFEGAAVCVVMASEGYPGPYQTGFEIRGLEQEEEDVIIFHAGTRREGDRLFTAGGRVLGVTGIGSGIPQAVQRAYAAVRRLSFTNAHYRTDIAHRALSRQAGR
jgi:phosphoribosylamine--glycine ligase